MRLFVVNFNSRVPKIFQVILEQTPSGNIDREAFIKNLYLYVQQFIRKF